MLIGVLGKCRWELGGDIVSRVESSDIYQLLCDIVSTGERFNEHEKWREREEVSNQMLIDRGLRID